MRPRKFMSNERYVVCETRIDPKNGAISVLTAHGPFPAKEDAVGFMETAYIEILKGLCLENNDAVNEDGETIPGGYFTDDEAGIYDYADFAFGQLLELVSLTIKKLSRTEAPAASQQSKQMPLSQAVQVAHTTMRV